MRILALGDVVGVRALAYLEERLWQVRREQRADFVIVNGENVSEIRGISQKDAQRLLNCGADVITLGNHAFGQKDLSPLLDRSECIIRPANFPPQTPGMGHTVFNANGWRILCINACGRVHMDTYSDPFDAVQRILDREKDRYDYAVLDFHAEATSEKWAIADYFSDRVNIIFGTHTHVPTADEQILPSGCAYITDVGMCGPIHSALGVKTEIITKRFRTALHERFDLSENPVQYQGILVTTNGFDKVSAVRRVVFDQV